MKIEKLIISLLLLLTYSVGFTHNLVPHCCDTPPHENRTTTHHHHSATDEQIAEHDHVTHNDHFDEGIYDYIICLVNEADNSETKCSVEHCFTINSNVFSLKKMNTLQTAVVLFAVVSIPVEDAPISNFLKKEELAYASPPIENSPHRGPPTFSC
jgi:hypothetical protein